jgi:hypothetical protein
VWQAIGVTSYLDYVGLLGSNDQHTPELPAFVHACYAIGVFAGLLGALALALRQRWAWLPLWLSLLALIAHWGWLLTQDEDASAPLGLAVLLVAILLVWAAERTRRGST